MSFQDIRSEGPAITISTQTQPARRNVAARIAKPQQTEPQQTQPKKTRRLPKFTLIKNWGMKRRVGMSQIHYKLQNGYHPYFRNPGEIKTKALISPEWTIEKARKAMTRRGRKNYGTGGAEQVLALFVPERKNPVGFMFFCMHHDAVDKTLYIELSLAWIEPSMRRRGLAYHLTYHLLDYIRDVSRLNAERFAAGTSVSIYADYCSRGGEFIGETFAAWLSHARRFADKKPVDVWPLRVIDVDSDCGW